MPTTIRDLEKQAATREQADAAIRELVKKAHSEGITIVNISRAARLSRPTIYRILAIVVMAVALIAPQMAVAIRPATSAERLVYDHAAWHLRSIGVNIPDFTVTVYPAAETPCGNSSNGEAYACAAATQVFLSETAAADARRYYRSARHTRRRVRALSISRCDTCANTSASAIHELVHVARFAVRPNESWVATDLPYEEGLAEAIACDQTGPMIYRVSGLRGYDSRSVVYETWVEMVYAVTDGAEAGRRNRLDAVAIPAVAFSMKPSIGVWSHGNP